MSKRITYRRMSNEEELSLARAHIATLKDEALKSRIEDLISQAEIGLEKGKTQLVCTQVPLLNFGSMKVGVRAWKLEPGFDKLGAVVMRADWNVLTIADEPPTTKNQHGLYSYELTPQSFGRYSPWSHEITGFIELSGDVVTHTDGVMRAEVARILCLFVPAEIALPHLIIPMVSNLMTRYPTVPVYILPAAKIKETIFAAIAIKYLRDKMIYWC